MLKRVILSSKRFIHAELINRGNESFVRVGFDDGRESNFHGIWLRDHCRCSSCHHPQTKQRLLDTCMIPIDIKPSKTLIEQNRLKLIWQDGHESVFDQHWLQENSYYPKNPIIKKRLKYWGKDLKENLPIVSFSDVMDDRKDGLLEWLENIVILGFNAKDTFGIGFVDGVPHSPKDTENLARRIAFIKETHYGGFYDFTANLAHGDTAYTNLALAAHTDTTYYTEPMGLQGFHLLHHDGSGGESLFVDGFNVAQRLMKESPSSYHILSKSLISAQSVGDKDNFIQPHPPSGFPILNLDPNSQELYQIRFNNDDRSPLISQNPSQVLEFYKALSEWIKLLKSREFEFWIKLTPGRFVLFNNWRVLHGRSSFSGSRRLVGCYLGMDNFQSKLKILKKSKN